METEMTNLLDAVARKSRAEADVPPVNALFVMGEKGGVGKSLFSELASTYLEDLGVPHTIAECEGDARLGRRLGDRVHHHRLGEHDARALAEDPDRLNAYWDNVYAQGLRGPMIADLAANAGKPFVDWLSVGSSRRALRHGQGVDIALLTTADTSSLMAMVNSAKAVRRFLPEAGIHIVLNPKDGMISADHSGVKLALEEAGCVQPITLPICRASDWGILKNLGRFTDVAAMDEADLEVHGIPRLRAGRALEQMGEWLLSGCETIAPVVAGLIERGGK
jgi:hypothetical protein